MRLRDEPAEFAGAITIAAQQLQLLPRQVEKDYWVTEILRALFEAYRGRMLFKGGTSLSKGWRIIDRFSEDIDLLLLSDPGGDTEGLLTQISDSAAELCTFEPIIDFEVPGHAQRIVVPFPRVQNLQRAPGMRRDILIEPGVRGGPRPHEEISIRPLLADGLDPGTYDDLEDLQAFTVDALHPARTFIEKLFAVDALHPARTFIEKLFAVDSF